MTDREQELISLGYSMRDAGLIDTYEDGRTVHHHKGDVFEAHTDVEPMGACARVDGIDGVYHSPQDLYDLANILRDQARALSLVRRMNKDDRDE